MTDIPAWVDALTPYVGYLIPLPVILPMLAAAICFVFGTVSYTHLTLPTILLV